MGWVLRGCGAAHRSAATLALACPQPCPPIPHATAAAPPGNCRLSTRSALWHTQNPTRRRHIPAGSFADFDYEPETPEEVAADWEGSTNDFEDAFFGTDAIDEVTEALFKESTTPEYYFQNALALALAALCIVSFAFIMLRLVVVIYSLIAAAVRYSVVAILVLVLFLLVA